MKFRHLMIGFILAIWIFIPIIALAGEKPVTITYWTDPRFKDVIGMEDITRNPGDFERLLADEFEALYPHVTIEVEAIPWEDMSTKVVTAIAGGNPPDILKDYLGRTTYYAYQGLLEPLDEYLPQEEKDDYIAGYWDLYTIHGRLHALPSHAWANNMVINKQIWKDAGKEDLLPDGHTWTFDEFETAVRAVAKPGELWPVGFNIMADGQGDYGYLGLIWGMGGKIYSDDYREMAINSPENVAALELMAKLNQDGLVNPGATTIPADDFNLMFWQHQIAVMSGSLAYFRLRDVARDQGNLKEPFDLDVIHWPHAPGVTNGLAIGPTGFAVFNQEDDYKREWVIKFARWLNSTDNIYTYILNSNQFPARESVEIPFLDDPAYVVINTILAEQGTEDMGLLSPAYSEVRAMYAPLMQEVLLGRRTPQAALAEIERQGNRILGRAWERLPEDIWAR